jgi:glucokinase
MLVAGDIGGTKTDLAVYANRSGLKSPIARKQFHSADYGSLHAIVSEFLADARIPVSHGVFGVPGPVINGSVATTNLPWNLEESSLAAALGFKSVHLINDLQAVAHAIPGRAMRTCELAGFGSQGRDQCQPCRVELRPV